MDNIDPKSIVFKELLHIQKNLKAPKNNYNKFGGYSSRSCEDILEAAKPLLDKCYIGNHDDLVIVNERYYIKATAYITDGQNTISATSFAREPEFRKGMDESQITGCASSYARKYALGALFGINDIKDADEFDNRGQKKAKKSNNKEKSTKDEAFDALDGFL